jgi:four helix bundle protein
MPRQEQEFRDRTKLFALRILKLYRVLPKTADAQAIGKLIRSGTSVAANHRAACRGRSHQEFAAKIGIVVEEADEALFWLELLAESGVINTERLSDLMQEAKELTGIFTATYHTAKKNQH